MLGDGEDFRVRLASVLPARWFSSTTPILDSLLSGLGAAWASSYSMLQYVVAQARISSARDIWLDMAAWDFFGRRLKRRANESDVSLRSRIKQEMFRCRATRSAIGSALAGLTGRTPMIFEPARTTDTGGYSSWCGLGGGLAYNSAGGWGSLSLPFQCFVAVYRPSSGGVGQIGGWGDVTGGFGGGSIEYVSLGMVQAQITDEYIYSTIADVIPAATICWTKIID